MAKILVTVASWEERFSLGTEQSLEAGGISEIHCLASARYLNETAMRRHRLSEEAERRGIPLVEHKFDFDDQVSAYRAIQKWAESFPKKDGLIFDLSTAPRNIMWTALSLLSDKLSNITMRYFRAENYADWQTEEEGDPKLIINRSGIMYPDRKTCLVMLCGPEISRAEKMFYRFEPRSVLILRDVDAHKYGDLKHIQQDLGATVQEVPFDNKDTSDQNFKKLAELVRQQSTDYNVVCTSFGPKLGALLLFRLAESIDEIGLGYVPSGRHNINSSSGIGPMMDFEVDLSAN